MRRRFSRVGVALALAGLLCACSRVVTAPAAGQRHPWTIPDTLRIAIAASPKTLNPILSTTTNESIAETFILDPLIATDPEGRDRPILAATVPTLENAGISKDGLTIVYHLRKNVRWHDGAPFTSHDVKFTVAAIMNPETPVSTRHGYDLIDRVDTPDRYTVVFHLRQRFAPAVHTFFAHSDSPYMILPAHLLERFKSLDRNPFNAAPIGTGPFKFVRWLRGDRIEYVANDDYFLGKPKLRHISLRFVQDENTIINQLKSHETDWFVQPTPRVYPLLRSIPGVAIRLVPFNGYDAIQFNVKAAPVDDARVRRAIGLAIDKRRLVDEITFGTTTPATEDLPSSLWAFDPRAGTTKHDLAQANALLDAAGWKRGPDGIRRRGGDQLNIGLAYRSDALTDRLRLAPIAAMLRDAGITVELKGYTTTLLFAAPGEGGILSGGRFQASLVTWFAGVDPDDSTQVLCDQFPPKGWNWSRYCNPKMDAAQRVALGNYDLPTRKRAYSTIENLMAEDAPWVYLWWPRQIEAVNDDLKGFRPPGLVENWNAYQWSI
jgi:peptide/nickel transport system substrate-binding protein